MHDEIVIEDLISPDERGMGELVLKGFEVNDYQYEVSMPLCLPALLLTREKVRQHSSWRLPWPSWERRYC